MNTSRFAVAMALIGSATALAAGCSSGGGNSLPPCNTGDAMTCTCENGVSSTRSCLAPNQWGECVCAGSGTGGTGAGLGGGAAVGGGVGVGGIPGVGQGGTPMGYGGTPVGYGGTPVGYGGTPVGYGGTPVGQGGTPTGSGGASTGCDADAYLPNLVNPDGWIGCDPALTEDNPQGIQGAFYLYGDEITCIPAAGNPCATGECCLDGATIVDDVDYASWGCGIGMELNSDGGDPSVKSPYSGSASCFAITLTGTSGGNAIRIGVTQMVDSEVAPFVEVPAVTGETTHTVCFSDISCPSWAIDQGTCEVTGQNYDLQIQVVGAERASTFTLCVSSIIPS
jgi:hypothetical protein